MKKSGEVKVGEDFSERVGSLGFYAMVYPNFAVNRYGVVADINYVMPLGVDRTVIVYDFFCEPEYAHRTDFMEKSTAASIRVQAEDTDLCQKVYRGMASRGFDRGRYAPSVELGTHHFHQLVARDMQRS